MIISSLSFNMQLVSQSYLKFFVITIFFLVSTALECKLNDPDPLKVAYTITVSKFGPRNFTTVGEAINFIPPGNNQWIRIYVDSGIYTEQVRIPKEKECIVLEGRSSQETIIAFDAHSTTLMDSATFGVYAENFVAKKITFKNSYNREVGGNPSPTPAIAFVSFADKHAFHLCAFEGYQDTLWDELGRHYFSSCYIEGAVDFIFGSGQSVYEQSTINVTGDGYITAQNRNAPTDPNGYVFSRCLVTGRGIVDLGRAYGPFSRVIFRNSKLDNVIRPEGWDIWKQFGHERDVTYAEVDCIGDGADTSRRSLEKKLSAIEVEQYYSTKAFINQDGWIDRLPCFFC